MQRKDTIGPGSFSITLFLFIGAMAIAGLLLGSCNSTAVAEPAAKKIRIGIPSNGWPPYIIVQQDRTTGIAIDVLKSIGAKKGYDLQTRFCPEKRGHLMVAQGKVDAWFDAKQWTRNPDRYFWTEPMVESQDLIISCRDKPVIFFQIDDLFGKTIGTQLGFVYPLLDRYFDSGNMVRSDTCSQAAMLKMLHMGRSDAAVANKLVALWIIKQDPEMDRRNFTFSDRIVGQASYRIMFTRRYDWAPFIAHFNAELNSMQQDGRLANLISEYR